MEVVNANPTDRSFLYGYHADASPAGSRIVYATCEYLIDYPADYAPILQSGGYEIATVNTDGSGRRVLPTTPISKTTGVVAGRRPHRLRCRSTWSRDRTGALRSPVRRADDHGCGRNESEEDRRFLRMQKLSALASIHPCGRRDGQRLAFIANEREGRDRQSAQEGPVHDYDPRGRTGRSCTGSARLRVCPAGRRTASDSPSPGMTRPEPASTWPGTTALSCAGWRIRGRGVVVARRFGDPARRGSTPGRRAGRRWSSPAGGHPCRCCGVVIRRVDDRSPLG